MWVNVICYLPPLINWDFLCEYLEITSREIGSTDMLTQRMYNHYEVMALECCMLCCRIYLSILIYLNILYKLYSNESIVSESFPRIYSDYHDGCIELLMSNLTCELCAVSNTLILELNLQQLLIHAVLHKIHIFKLQPRHFRFLFYEDYCSFHKVSLMFLSGQSSVKLHSLPSEPCEKQTLSPEW